MVKGALMATDRPIAGVQAGQINVELAIASPTDHRPTAD